MTKERNVCSHDALHFGSGDYYVFCADCGARWAAMNPVLCEYGVLSSGDMVGADPDVANKGIGATLSGQQRLAVEPAGDPLALAIVEEVIRQHPQIECKGGKCPETMWCEQEAECLWTRWNK